MYEVFIICANVRRYVLFAAPEASRRAGAVFAIAAQQSSLFSLLSYRAAATNLLEITNLSFKHRVIGGEQKL